MGRPIDGRKHKQNSHSAREELFAIRERGSQEIGQERRRDTDKEDEFADLYLKIETEFGVIGINPGDALGTFGT